MYIYQQTYIMKQIINCYSFSKYLLNLENKVYILGQPII
jgi:hypothetical protein